MVTKLLISSILFNLFPLIGFSQNSDSLFFDSVFVRDVCIDRIYLGDSKNVLFQTFWEPNLYEERVSEYDGTKFFICTYDNKASFLLDENEKIFAIEYLMIKNIEIKIQNSSFFIGDSLKNIAKIFPNSYKKYLSMNSNIIYLIGIEPDGVRAGINFQIIIKENKVYSFSSNIEE